MGLVEICLEAIGSPWGHGLATAERVEEPWYKLRGGSVVLRKQHRRNRLG